jgi:hypothetical protein
LHSVNNTPSKEELIADMKALLLKHERVTRDFYRQNGAFPERVCSKVFPSFKEFIAAATEGNPNQESAPVAEPEKQEFVGDHWDISLPKTRIHTLDELLEYCKVDLSIWRVERFLVNRWEMGSKDAAKNVQVTPLYQVKASLVRKNDIVAAKAEIEDLKNEAKRFVRVHLPIIRSDRKSGNCLELLIPDLHAGKLAYGKETGHGDYDTPTAIATYERAVASILDKAHGYDFEEILVGVGNDILNSDNYNSQTTKGTQVNSDTRYPKTYKAVRQMLVRTIENLRLIAPVKVKVIPGNHDAQTSFCIGDSLECWFHNDPEVDVDNAPGPHKFYTWGKVLLGLTHGDKGKKSDYGIWMATERPHEFGNSKFREVHLGHTHGLKVEEKFGVRVRTFAALCEPDFWHASEHFVGNLRQAEGIVWNKEVGRIAEFIHTEVD